MKKIFTLFAAMLVALTVSAKVKYITPTSPYGTHSNLQLALHYAHTEKFDTIMLGGGTYVESNNYLYMDTNMVIMASDTAKSVPIVKIVTEAQITKAAKIKIKGIIFDGSSQNSYDGFIRFCDNSHSSLILDDCEFYAIKKDVISVTSSSNHTDSLIVNDCYFHNNDRSAIYFEASSTEGRQTCDKLVVKNSTFANFTTMDGHHLIEIRNFGYKQQSDIRTIVDHCTFYNYGKRGLEFEALYSYKSTNVSVTNSIFSNDTIPGQRATWLYGGSVSNCLVNNVINKNYTPQATVTNGITGDPLFVNASSNNFALKGDWKKGEISPARGAATDGTDLGDPRWYTPETLPEVDFSEPYECTAAMAQHSGHIALVNKDSLVFSHDGNNQDGVAKWKMNITKSCYFSVAINLTPTSSSGHLFKVSLLDSKGKVLDSIEESSTAWASVNLSGILYVPEEGDYYIKLSNSTPHSSTRLTGLTLTYYDDPMNMYLDATVWDAGEGTENYAVWDSEHLRWSKFMTLVAGEDHLYVATMPRNDKQLIFVRLNGNTAKEAPSWDDKWNETNGLTRSGYDNLYTITGWGSGENAKSTGEWSVYGAKYYIAGDFTSWNDEKIPVCDGNSYTITGLTAGVHSFKIVDGGNWYGMSALASIAGGYLYPSGDDAILFKLAAAGDVTITYIKNTELSIEGAIAPDVALNGAEDIFGGWDGEKSIVMTAQEGGVYASKTMALPAGNYHIKVVFEGQWLSCNGANDTQYYITSENHTVSGLSTDKQPFLLQAEKAGDYTFTWTFATGTLDVTFPSPATDIDNTVVGEKAVKLMENGQLVIIKNGVRYNVLGTVVR